MRPGFLATESERQMIYFRLFGNLGNLLFQYATALSLGKGKAVGVTDSEKTLSQINEYSELFMGLETVPSAPVDAIVVEQFRCDHTTFPDPAGRNLFISGYFQSEQYFDRGLVYKTMKPSEARIESIRKKYGSWLSRPDVTGISVRRGDYLKKAAWHPFVGEKYFRDCIARFPNVKDFIVCSDGMKWCKKFFPNAFPDKRFLFIEEESVINQLFIQSLCANNIVSNSSFSWWGAWLAEQRRRSGNSQGLTLAPSMWLGYAPKSQGAVWNDIYFDGMEIIKNNYSLRLWISAHWPIFAEKD